MMRIRVVVSVSRSKSKCAEMSSKIKLIFLILLIPLLEAKLFNYTEKNDDLRKLKIVEVNGIIEMGDKKNSDLREIVEVNDNITDKNNGHIVMKRNSVGTAVRLISVIGKSPTFNEMMAGTSLYIATNFNKIRNIFNDKNKKNITASNSTTTTTAKPNRMPSFKNIADINKNLFVNKRLQRSISAPRSWFLPKTTDYDDKETYQLEAERAIEMWRGMISPVKKRLQRSVRHRRNLFLMLPILEAIATTFGTRPIPSELSREEIDEVVRLLKEDLAVRSSNMRGLKPMKIMTRKRRSLGVILPAVGRLGVKEEPSDQHPTPSEFSERELSQEEIDAIVQTLKEHWAVRDSGIYMGGLIRRKRRAFGAILPAVGRLGALTVVMTGVGVETSYIDTKMKERMEERLLDQRIDRLARHKLDCGKYNYGCMQGNCWTNCGPRVSAADWCYTTKNATDLKNVKFQPCTNHGDCDPCWTCAASCIMDERN